MGSSKLLEMLRASGARLRRELNERLIVHPGELGQNREEILRQFLRDYLPKRYEVSTGFAFDCHGNLSQQLDVVIADSMVCPRLETSGGIRLFPCESVVAVAQVKSSLTSREHLNDALRNLASAKILDRSANGHAFDPIRGENIDPLNNHLHQIFTFLFVIGEALDGKTVRQELLDHVQRTPVHIWPNVLFAFDSYLVTFCCDSGVCPNPMDARGIALENESSQQDILLKLYLLLSRAIDQTRVASLPYWQYLESVTTWSAEVAYSSAEYPPPYLSSLSVV